MRTVFCLIFVFLLSGCGTIFMGDQQAIVLHSPEGLDDAEITINGRSVTPNNGLIWVDKKQDGLFISVKKRGYYDQSLYSKRDIHPFALAGDIIFLPGMLIDLYTGGWYYYMPDKLSLTLRKMD